MPHFLAIVLFVFGSALAQSSLFGGSASLLSGEQSLPSRSATVLQPAYSEVQVDSSYVLGPGDFLDIMLENKYLTVQIYPDGSVAIEECGAVVVGGKTVAEARQLILDLVGKRYKREYCFVQLSSLKAAYFESHVEDGICWLIVLEHLRAENVARSRVRGAEFELKSTPASFLDVVLRATFQKTEDRSKSSAYNGNVLPGEPARSYFAEATLHLPLHLDLMWASEWRSVIYSDRANRMNQPAVANHRAVLSCQPFEKTRFAFSVDNITDEKYRNFYTPFPMPGREYKFTIIQGF